MSMTELNYRISPSGMIDYMLELSKLKNGDVFVNKITGERYTYQSGQVKNNVDKTLDLLELIQIFCFNGYIIELEMPIDTFCECEFTTEHIRPESYIQEGGYGGHSERIYPDSYDIYIFKLKLTNPIMVDVLDTTYNITKLILNTNGDIKYNNYDFKVKNTHLEDALVYLSVKNREFKHSGKNNLQNVSKFDMAFTELQGIIRRKIK